MTRAVLSLLAHAGILTHDIGAEVPVDGSWALIRPESTDGSNEALGHLCPGETTNVGLWQCIPVACDEKQRGRAPGRHVPS